MKLVVKIFLIYMLANYTVFGQGIIITGDKVPAVTEPFEKIDPARYHKIQIIDVKIGNLNSDDRGFQSLLKYYGFKPGSRNFITAGADYNFLVKKLNLGASGSFAVQTSGEKNALNHTFLQANLGYALIRKQNKILLLKSNFGLETSTIRFGHSPPDFLAQLNYSHDSSKLFQKQFIMGPAINFYRLFNKMHMDRGFSLGIEAGVNFAPFKATWQYGYDDENFDFIGEEIMDMPQTARQTYFTTIKFGFWVAK